MTISNFGTNPVLPVLNGETYRVRVRAINDDGAGDWALSLSAATPRNRASSPVNVNGIVGDQQVSIWWEAPNNTDGGTISNYTVTHTSVDGSVTVAYPFGSSVPTEQSPLVIDELYNGTLYSFEIKAVTEVGEGDPDTSLSLRPAVLPGVPENLAVAVGDESLNVTWEEPIDDGGEVITGYRIEWSTSDFVSLTGFENVPAAPLSFTIPNLTNGREYSVRIRSENAIGESSNADSVDRIPGRLSTAPQNFTAAPNDQQVRLTWSAPSDPGGGLLSVLGYKIFWKETGSAWPQTPNKELQPQNNSYFVFNLTNGQEYDFKIQAVTAFGDGIAAEELEIVPSTLPSAPTNLQISGLLNAVTVTWDVPANGGAEIEDYVVQYRKGTGVWESFDDGESNTPSVTVDGLENGVPVAVRVAAVNAVGQGAYSEASDQQSPGVGASAPTISEVVIGDGEITLRWQPPTSTGELPITGYRVQKRLYNSANGPNDNWTTARTTSSTTQEAVVQSLDNGTKYDLRVAALTSFGAGTYAVVEEKTPAGPAAAPTGLIVNASSGTALLEWTAPADDGGSAISGHRVQYRVLGTDAWSETTYTSAVAAASVTGLSNGQTYEFRVAALTSYEGVGAYSEISQRMIGDVPAAPPNLQVVRVGTQVIAEWHDATAPQGVTIEGYTVEYRRADQNFWTLGATVPEPGNTAFMSVSRFNLSFEYEFRIAAVANTGTGNYATSGPKLL